MSRISNEGLTLFFVLSGFLITYLLLTEQRNSGKISIRNFYIRRILRIWPLYYLIIILGQLIIPFTGWFGLEYNINQNFFETTVCYLFFLPNIAQLVIGSPNPYIAFTWSIGSEEQFYLIWPLVIRKCRKNLFPVLWLLIILAFLSAVVYGALGNLRITGPMHLFTRINAFFYWSRIGYFALGGLMAFYKLNRPGVVEKLCSRAMQLIILLLSCAIMLAETDPVREFVLAILFSILILNATYPGTLLSRLDNPIFLYLGKISYGMYIFHIISGLITLKLLEKSGAIGLSKPVFCLLACILVMGINVLLGTLSYYYFESFFLRLKNRFQLVRSGYATAKEEAN